MSEAWSPAIQRVYDQVAAQVQESLKAFVAQPYNRDQVVAAVARTLAQQAERFGLDGGATHALVSLARAEGRPWLWGLPCFGVPEVPDDQVLLARLTGEALPMTTDTSTPDQVTVSVGFAVLRSWRVTWPPEGEPQLADLLRIRAVDE